MMECDWSRQKPRRRSNGEIASLQSRTLTPTRLKNPTICGVHPDSLPVNCAARTQYNVIWDLARSMQRLKHLRSTRDIRMGMANGQIQRLPRTRFSGKVDDRSRANLLQQRVPSSRVADVHFTQINGHGQKRRTTIG